MCKMVGGDMNSNRGVHRIHLKVVFGTGEPQFGVISIKLGKLHFGQLAKEGGIDGR